jgi:hypothetical protein
VARVVDAHDEAEVMEMEEMRSFGVLGKSFEIKVDFNLKLIFFSKKLCLHFRPLIKNFSRFKVHRPYLK